MNPELPYLAAGGIAIAGAAVKEKRWPSNSTKGIIGTVILVLVASASKDTVMAPLVRAIGLLFLLAAVLTTVRIVDNSRKGSGR